MKPIALKTWYKVHKWIFVVMGSVILMWLITGIVMTSAGLFLNFSTADSSESPALPDFQQVTMSPADAIVHMERILGKTPEVSWVNLKRVGDELVYQVVLTNGPSYLINAESGEQIKITSELAEQLARNSFPTQAPILGTEHLNRYDLSYSYGPLPVYRVVFGDSLSTYLHVSGVDGSIASRNNRLSRIRNFFGSVHTFGIFKIITGRNRPITGILWLVSIIAIVGSLVGYYLAVPTRWRQSPQALKRTSTSVAAGDEELPVDL